MSGLCEKCVSAIRQSESGPGVIIHICKDCSVQSVAEYLHDDQKEIKDLVHEEYKQSVKLMLFDFFLASTDYFKGKSEEEISYRDIQKFIGEWASLHFQEPREDWNP